MPPPAICDRLEPRELYSVSPVDVVPTLSMGRDHTLIVTGTSGTDRVDIRSTDDGVVIRLNADGSVRKRFAPGVVQAVQFEGGGGSDSVTLDPAAQTVTGTNRVEHRTVRYADGESVDNFSTLAEPGMDEQDQEHWLRRYKRQQKAMVGQTPTTVFIGDSLMERMPSTGTAEWESLASKYDAADLGFSGDTTSSLLYRLNHDLLKGLWPRTIFLSVGTNNVALTDDVNSTVRGIRKVIETLQTLRPQAKIVLSSILPRGVHTATPNTDTVDAVNAKLDDLAEQYDAVFADAAAAFPQVKLQARDFDQSSIHLSHFGYAKWVPVIENSLHTALIESAR